MKICTHNVNSIRARKELVLEWLDHRKHDIDVLCLQELKTVDEEFPAKDFEELGFQCHIFGQKAYNGVAVCSKIPADKARLGFDDDRWDEQRRFMAVHLEGIHLINIYAPHGDIQGSQKFQYKMDWYKRLIAYLNDHHSPTDPVLIVGDFNVAHKDIDVYSSEDLADSIGTMPEERAAFQELLDWKLIDVFRRLHPEKKQWTWWDYIGGAIWKDQGMRIDYMLCTEPLLDKIKSLEVDLWPRKRRKPTPSDHAPLIADLV